jgi:hypothetical protein
MTAILRAWRAGFTRRWHNNFDLCDTLDYTAGHQGRVAVLLLGLFPDASRTLIVEALFHDQGEAGPGDISYDAKKRSPELRAIVASQERAERARQNTHETHLSETEAAQLKLCDWLDAWLWMMRHARHLYARRDWQDQITAMQGSAWQLGVGPEVLTLIETEASRAA